MPVLEITENSEFMGLIQKNDFVVVDFFAKWCGPCKKLAPQFEYLSLQEKYKNIIFCKVDVDEVNEVADLCNVSSLPSIVAFDKGCIFDSVIGLDIEKINKLIDDLITID
jgi:thioredoxin 1